MRDVINDRMNKIKKMIEELINKGLLEEAKKGISEYENVVSGDVDICSMKAVIAIMEGEKEKALDILLSGLEIDENNFDILYNLGYVNEILFNYNEALRYYEEAEKNVQNQGLKDQIKQVTDNIKFQYKDELKEKRDKLAFFVKKGMDSFLKDIIKELAEEYEVKKIIVSNYNQIDKGMEWADICWFEWCDEIAVYGSNLSLAKEKKIVCRIHGYEVYTNYIKEANWENMDNVIIVAPHIRRIFEENIESIDIGDLRIHTVFCGINVDKYSLNIKCKGFNLGYLGYINFKKNIPLTLDIFKKLYDSDNRYKLYLAGQFQDARTLAYLKFFIKEYNLEDNVFFDGWLNHKQKIKWFKKIDYMIISSIDEGLCFAAAESMCSGIKPILHNCEGIKDHYDKKYIFNTINEAVEMVKSELYDSIEYRDYIRTMYSLEKEYNCIKKIFSDLKEKQLCESSQLLYKNNSKIQIQDIDEIISIYYYGRSGTFFLQSLLDNHSNILMMPGDYLRFYCEFWDLLKDKYGNYIDKEILISYFCNGFPFIFDVNANSELFANTYAQYGGAFGKYLNFDAMGDNCDEILQVNKNKFISELRESLKEKFKVSRKEFFVAVHIAYFYSLGRQYNGKDSLKIVFNPHKYDLNSYIDFLKEFKIYKRICMVRDPVQSTGSNFKSYLDIGLDLDINYTISLLQSMLLGGTCSIEDNDVCAIKLEDLHTNSKNTLLNICKFLNIEWNDTLLESTFGGLKWWNKKNSDKINGFSNKIVSKSHEDIFNDYDGKRLRFILKDKYKVWNYDIKNTLNSTEILNEIYKPFVFEKYIRYKDKNESQIGAGLIRNLFMEYIKIRSTNTSIKDIDLLT